MRKKLLILGLVFVTMLFGMGSAFANEEEPTITFDKTEITIKSGQYDIITATTTSIGLEDTLIWQSDNPQIAELDDSTSKTRYVAGYNVGDATITCYLESNPSVCATCTVHVVQGSTDYYCAPYIDSSQLEKLDTIGISPTVVYGYAPKGEMPEGSVLVFNRGENGYYIARVEQKYGAYYYFIPQGTGYYSWEDIEKKFLETGIFILSDGSDPVEPVVDDPTVNNPATDIKGNDYSVVFAAVALVTMAAGLALVLKKYNN